MKLIALYSVAAATCGALAPACASAQDGTVQIYGRLNVALEHVSASADASAREVASTRESNNRSVLGFKGSEDLDGGLKAIFQIEGTLALDTGAGAIAARDTRLGLEGRFGTLFAGNWTTPYNSATAALDPFYPTTGGYMSIMGNGSASSADNLSDTSSFDRRQQNSVHYWTPPWHGLTLRLAQGLNEEAPASGARPALSSAALIYEAGPLYLTVTGERHHDYQGPRRNDSGRKIALAWNVGATRLAAIAEKLSYDTASGGLERSACYLSATHQFGAHGLRFGAARAGDGRGTAAGRIGFIKAGADTGATHYTAGYDYTLSKRTSIFAYYTRLRNDKNASYDFAINGVGAAVGVTLKGSALGLRHNF
jgi:predicted porin